MKTLSSFGINSLLKRQNKLLFTSFQNFNISSLSSYSSIPTVNFNIISQDIIGSNPEIQEEKIKKIKIENSVNCPEIFIRDYSSLVIQAKLYNKNIKTENDNGSEGNIIITFGKNSRAPKKANHGARPCSSVMRKLKFKDSLKKGNLNDKDDDNLNHNNQPKTSVAGEPDEATEPAQP